MTLHEVSQAVRDLLGIGLEDLSIGQMTARAALIYVIATFIVRLGKKRFMSRGTAFDLILAIVLGSIVARVITGDAPFLPGLAAALTLVVMHWLFSAIGLTWKGFSRLVKGEPVMLVRDGAVDWTAMRRSHLAEGDLWEDLREKGVSDLDEVKEARLERSGRISVIRRT